MATRVTIKTIAKDLGISHMTVSRALSDHPNVQKETRELVRKRAAELGYVKIAAATAMRGDGTKIVGLVLPNIVNEFYARFANDLAGFCEELSYQLIIHLTNDDAASEWKAIQQLREVQAKALVVVPAPDTADYATKEQLRLEGLDIVQLIRQRKMTGNETAILVEDGRAISNAVKHLKSAGHNKIAYIGANAQLSSGRNRLAAFESGLKKFGLDMITDLTKTGPPSFETGREYARKILMNGEATALVCGGFEISNGALDALLTSGRIPGPDFAFIGYGDPSFYTWVAGGVSTIGVPVTPLAQKVLEVLSGASGDRKQNATHSFDAELIVRKT